MLFYQNSFIRVFVIFFSVVLLASGAEPSELLQITKSTPVFERPNKSSKILADVDAPAMIYLIKSSPRKLWLYVSDEDGNKGWVPRSRTNYGKNKELKAKPTKIDNQNMAVTRNTLTQNERRRPESTLSLSYKMSMHSVSASFRSSWVDKSSSPLFGVRYDFIQGKYQSKLKRDLRHVFSAGFWKGDGSNKAIAVPLRYAYMISNQNQTQYWGPDIGLLYESPSKNVDHWSLSLGFNVQYYLTPNAYFQMRPSIEMLSYLRGALELSAGVIF